MIRKWFVAVSAAVFPLITAVYFAGRSVTAEANSAPPYWEGTDASGAIVKGEACPVVVEKEVLTLNIGSLPRQGKLELDSYYAEAIAEYSFYNPTDLDVDMTLLFPFGEFPSYVSEVAGDEVSAVSVDGVVTECNVRHTYARDGRYSFDVDRDMSRVLEEKKSDTFYREDMPVMEYRLDIQAQEKDFAMRLKLSFNAKKTRVLFPPELGARLSISGGDMYAYTRFDEYEEKRAVFYAVGEPLDAVVPKLYDDKEDRELGASYTSQNREMTFSQFAMSDWSEETGVSETDWYNAFVDMLNERSGVGGSVDCFSLTSGDLMRWYEYDMSIPAKGRATNRVRAPLYPTVEGNKNPRYEYSYLLSPAGKWADFKGIEICINTPFYLSNGSLDFERRENEEGRGFSYVYTRDALPQGELTFVLTEKDAADSDFNVFGKDFFHPSLTWAFVTLTVLAVVAAVVTVVVVVSLRKKK